MTGKTINQILCLHKNATQSQEVTNPSCLIRGNGPKKQSKDFKRAATSKIANPVVTARKCTDKKKAATKLEIDDENWEIVKYEGKISRT
jgi:hypothetical protein